MCLGAATGILTTQVGEIESIDDFHDEASQMILGGPVIYRWGQQLVGLAVGENEIRRIDKNPS